MTKRGFEFPEPSSQAEACFVYLIKRSDGMIKVGVLAMWPNADAP